MLNVGLVVVVIMGIVALTAVAATAGVVLHKEIQTAEFIRDQHRDSEELSTEQNQIDTEIVNELAELRQAIVLLWDQLEILKQQIKLKCDWNVYCYCITPLRFNESKND